MFQATKYGHTVKAHSACVACVNTAAKRNAHEHKI